METSVKNLNHNALSEPFETPNNSILYTNEKENEPTKNKIHISNDH
jgi:hypothetical protein